MGDLPQRIVAVTAKHPEHARDQIAPSASSPIQVA